jgi:ArsR family transcriptional regulator, arsenate/arsenite/antimonite-responsive transcriptional repressor
MGRPRVTARLAALVGQDEALLLGLQALADPIRLRMVRLLGEREQCVCHLTEALGLSQASISHHVAVLKRAGLVEDRRDTRWTYYRLSPASTELLRRSVDGLLEVSRAAPADCCKPEERGSAEPASRILAPAIQARVPEVTCSEATSSHESSS